MSRPILKVVCAVHDRVIARVVETDEGPAYETYRPVLAGKLFVAAGEITRGLGRKNGQHLPEVAERPHVLLASKEAERYTWARERWGTLPAWCRDCGDERWLDLGMLRTTKGTTRV